MGLIRQLICVLLLALAPSSPSVAGDRSPLLEAGGGGDESTLDPENGSIPPSERELARELIELYVVTFGPLSTSPPGEEPPPFLFFPVGGRLGEDLLTLSFVDLDPGPGVLDMDCKDQAENGHQGNDTLVRTFAEQEVGVPVLAMSDGVVVAAHDGEVDQNVAGSESPSNFLIIDHGFGREVWYWHLKRDSLSVSVGETVLAGQQIAQVGSSGNSEAPHLHLEVRIDGVAVEPYGGPCNPRESLWLSQPAVRRDTYLLDFGVTTANLANEPDWPARWPATGQVGLSDPLLRVWFLGANLPPGASWKVRFRRPDGSFVQYDQPQSFGNTEKWRRFHWWWTYDVFEMHTTPGIWHILLLINDELMVEAPVEVLPDGVSAFNRPPYPVSIRFDPPEPLGGDVVGCLVDTSLTLDDPDFDVVSYEFVWVVNEDIVRQTTTAGHADYLSPSAFKDSDMITCVVTPTDGEANANSSATAIPAKRPAVPAVSSWALLTLSLLIVSSATLILRRSLSCAGST